MIFWIEPKTDVFLPNDEKPVYRFMPQEPLWTDVWKSAKSVSFFQKKLNNNDKISSMLLFLFTVEVINKE